MEFPSPELLLDLNYEDEIKTPYKYKLPYNKHYSVKMRVQA